MIAGFIACVFSASLCSKMRAAASGRCAAVRALSAACAALTSVSLMISDMYLVRFGAHDLVAGLDRRLEGVPREAGALDAGGMVANTFEHGELAELFSVCGFAGDHLVELSEHRSRVVERLAFDAVGHHRGGRLGDGAAGALKAG